jgi:hypothetical protein
MLRYLTRYIHQIHWFVTGEASDLLVNDYNEPCDAIAHPVVNTFITAVLVWFSRHVFLLGGPVNVVFSLAAFAFAVVGFVQVLAAVLASYWYATERTEIDDFEGGDRRAA